MNININNNNSNSNCTLIGASSSSSSIGAPESIGANRSIINSGSSINFGGYFENLQEPDEDVVVDEEEELGHAETYANYMPSKCEFKRLNIK